MSDDNKATVEDPTGSPGGDVPDLVKGSCLCGACEITADVSKKIFSVICHCTICQRLGSANGQAIVGFDGKALQIVKGSDHLDSYRTSESMTRYRCQTCGGSVYNQSHIPEMDFRDTPLAIFERDEETGQIKINVLDKLAPDTHIFCAHRNPSLVGTDPPSVVRFMGFPGQSEKMEE